MNKNNIYNADCFELMPQITDATVDMIFCDLPYGNTNCEWDKLLPLDNLWSNWLRIIKPTGTIVLTAMEPLASKIILSQPNIFRYDIIWDKVGVTGFLNAKKMPLRKHEHILIFYKKPGTYNPQKMIGKAYSKTRTKVAAVYNKVNNVTSNTDGLIYPNSILSIKKESCNGSNAQRKENSYHPTQKPVELLEYLIKTYTNEGELVLDNCAGSCTTAIACINTKRDYMCIEKDSEYYKKSLDRISKHILVETKLQNTGRALLF